MTRLDNLYGMVKQEWTKQEILDEIDDINDDFQSRICENCKSFTEREDISHLCTMGNSCGIDEYGIPTVLRTWGCNEFERKDK